MHACVLSGWCWAPRNKFSLSFRSKTKFGRSKFQTPPVTSTKRKTIAASLVPRVVLEGLVVVSTLIGVFFDPMVCAFVHHLHHWDLMTRDRQIWWKLFFLFLNHLFYPITSPYLKGGEEGRRHTHILLSPSLLNQPLRKEKGQSLGCVAGLECVLTHCCWWRQRRDCTMDPLGEGKT